MSRYCNLFTDSLLFLLFIRFAITLKTTTVTATRTTSEIIVIITVTTSTGRAVKLFRSVTKLNDFG